MGKGASGETLLCPEVFRTRLSKLKSQSLSYLCSAGTPLFGTQRQNLWLLKRESCLSLLKRDRSMWGEIAWGYRK